MTAWKEKRREMRQDHKDRMKAYRAGDYSWKKPDKGEDGKAWEPSDLEKIIGKSASLAEQAIFWILFCIHGRLDIL